MGVAIQLVKQVNPRGEWVSGVGTIFRQAWAALVAPGNTGIHAAITCPASGTTTVTTAISNPAVPRVVRIKGNAASVTGNVVVVGTNQFGAAATDTIASNGVAAVDGVVAFAAITSITVPVRGAGGDTISLGPGAAVGLSRAISDNGAAVMSASVDGTREGTLPTMNKTYNTAAFNTAADSAKSFVLYYVHEDLTHL